MSRFGLGFVGSRPPAVLTFTASVVNSADLTTYTFSAQAIGTAASDRVVVCALDWFCAGTITITSVTIGGVAATRSGAVVEASTRGVGIYYAAVPTGTTADVVIVMSAGAGAMGIGLWAGYNMNPTPVDAEVIAVTDTVATFPALSTQAEGAALWVINSFNGTSSWTWTGGPTERYDAALETSTTHSGADVTATIGANVTAVATGSGSSSLKTGACVSFR